MKIFYNPTQSLDGYPSEPSLNKPKLLIEALKAKGLKLNITDFYPVNIKQIKQSHDGKYVDNIIDLSALNGFGLRDKAINESLLWTNGSIVAAAINAYKFKTITCSPTSGFHHSMYSEAGGFCTFNGLMIATIELLKIGGRPGILDFDYHFGDGTQNIINKLNLNNKVVHYSSGHSFNNKTMSQLFLKEIPNILNQFKNCDIIIYQAGADMHIDDLLGGLLTTEEMIIRDQMVFKFCKENNIPLVWNLAGGYQTPIQKVLNIHIATFNVMSNNKL